MGTEKINGHDLQKMLTSGLSFLSEKYKEVDLLNVFPVPDGDTGTNMYLTLTAAVEEAGANDVFSVGKVAGAVSRGALMGARGNSGVILSQLLRGFSLSVANKDSITGKEFSKALMEGVEIAFRAVMKPVEGTILTVAREAAKTAVREANRSRFLDVILRKTCETAEYTLKQTPDMLPALKEAGVVDAGGMGWLIILQGFLKALTGETIHYEALKNPSTTNASEFKNNSGMDGSRNNFDFKFPYCTEILLKTLSDETDSLREQLNSLGDSLLVVYAEGIVKVHIHTANPETALGVCLKAGPVSNVKITNMNEQAVAISESKHNTGVPDKTGNSFGVISVASGEGITKLMKSLGADEIITGGQSMNPSIQDLVTAAEKINSDTIIILPNNSNIIMSANQVLDLTQKSIKVVPTRTIPEGLAALLAIAPGMTPEDAYETMLNAYEGVKTGEVTYAVRATTINGVAIEEGNIIGLFGDEITVGDTVPDTVTGMLEKMISPENEICSIYYGDAVNAVDAENLVEALNLRFPDVDIELHHGGQPIYYYIISVE